MILYLFSIISLSIIKYYLLDLIWPCIYLHFYLKTFFCRQKAFSFPITFQFLNKRREKEKRIVNQRSLPLPNLEIRSHEAYFEIVIMSQRTMWQKRGNQANVELAFVSPSSLLQSLIPHPSSLLHLNLIVLLQVVGSNNK